MPGMSPSSGSTVSGGSDGGDAFEIHPEQRRPDPIRRRRVAAMAGHRGDDAVARSYRDDPDPKVREAALRALDQTGSAGRDELERALADEHPAVRMAALELAAGRPEVPAGSVAAGLEDPDPRVVEIAAWACGEFGFDPDGADLSGVISALSSVAADHDDALCRESAVAALGSLAHPSGLPAILAGLDDKPAVRRRAVIALAPFDGLEVDAALDRARSDRDRQVREAAEELLGLGPAPGSRALAAGRSGPAQGRWPMNMARTES